MKDKRLLKMVIEVAENLCSKNTRKNIRAVAALLNSTKEANNKFKKVPFGMVRVIESSATHFCETVLSIVMRQEDCSYLCYELARNYAELYEPQCGTGLLPNSSLLVKDIADFFVLQNYTDTKLGDVYV